MPMNWSNFKNTTPDPDEVTTITYTQKELMDLAYDVLNEGRNQYNSIPIELIRQVISAYENVITTVLKDTNEDTDIVAKIFNGIRLEATYVPEHQIPLYKEKKLARARIKVKPKVSKFYNYSTINGFEGMGGSRK